MDSCTLERIHALWDELTALPAGEVDDAALRLMNGVGEMIGAGNAVWVGGVRMPSGRRGDPLQGWRAPVFRQLRDASPEWSGRTRAIQKMWQKRRMDPSFLLGVQNTGRHRCYSFRRALPAEWFDSPYYLEYWQHMGIHDVAVACCPVNSHAEVHYLFHRMQPQDYDAADLATLAQATRGLKWLHTRLLLSHGLPLAQSPFSAAERKVLKGLLTDRTEKEIATACGMAATTVHHYAGGIYRKLGVRGRAGLMSLWLQ